MRSRLILMLKYPRPGAVKTRLIPALGAARACELHRTLVRHTLAEAKRFTGCGESSIEVRITGAPDGDAARAWLGVGLALRDQGDGDLGQRMERAVRDAFSEGAAQVVVIGGDCPQLAAEHLAAAFAALARADVAIGPANDGGYYLIGLRRSLPALFSGIAWGGPAVLGQTLAAAHASSAVVTQLPKLGDIDVPADLPLWAQMAAATATGRGGISVIVPALDEEAHLPATLAAVRREAPHEIIVVDGGSTDRTVEIARAHDAIVLTAPASRGGQMNAGAAIATGEFLLFLHADTIPPVDYAALVRTALASPGVTGGAFEFALSGEFTGRRLIERGTNWRARRHQMPYGDQGLFLRRATFAELGGFPDLPIMEDYEFVRRLRRLGRIALAPGIGLTSARRWQRLGVLRTTLMNQCLLLGYRLGIRPARLAGWYRGE